MAISHWFLAHCVMGMLRFYPYSQFSKYARPPANISVLSYAFYDGDNSGDMRYFAEPKKQCLYGRYTVTT